MTQIILCQIGLYRDNVFSIREQQRAVIQAHYLESYGPNVGNSGLNSINKVWYYGPKLGKRLLLKNILKYIHLIMFCGYFLILFSSNHLVPPFKMDTPTTCVCYVSSSKRTEDNACFTLSYIMYNSNSSMYILRAIRKLSNHAV